MNSSENIAYTGTSSTGNIAEALDAAITRAKESIPASLVKWKLTSMEGINGGFVETNVINVTISATADAA